MRRMRIVIPLVVVCTILACDVGSFQLATASKPTVAVDAPPNGAEFRAGQEIVVQASASDSAGIARVELWVDNALATTAQPPAPQPQFSATLRWTAVPGAHTLTVKAINPAGAASDPASVGINVLAPVTPTQTLAPPTVTPTARPTAAPTASPTASVKPTQAATLAPTAPPVQPTSVATFSALTFSPAFDANSWAPINPGKVFAYGTKIIYACWAYSGAKPDADFQYEWLRYNAHVDGDKDHFVQSAGKSVQWLINLQSDQLALDPGNYQFIVRVGSTIVLSDTFVIQ